MEAGLRGRPRRNSHSQIRVDGSIQAIKQINRREIDSLLERNDPSSIIACQEDERLRCYDRAEEVGRERKEAKERGRQRCAADSAQP